MPKINLFIFHPFSGYGGADRSIARLINNLPAKKYKIFFICLNKPNIKIFLNKQISIIKLNKSRTLFSMFKLKKILINKISLHSKNIFISNQNFSNVLSIIFLRRVKNLKIILIERNSIEELNFNNNFIQFLKNFIIKNLMRLTYKYSNCVICISKQLCREIKKICKCKIIQIYNPALDLRILKKIRNKNRIKIKENYIISIGRLEKQKDHTTLIKAFKELKDKNNYKLLIIGYGSKYNQLKKLIKNFRLNKFVKIYTNIRDANYLVKNSKLFVLSSKYEGFGNVLIEAGINKIPIISSNCNHGPAEILGKGKYGDLFEVGDSTQLSFKIQKFINNQESLKRKSRNFYKSLNRFDTKRIICKYENIFMKI